jgi:hypothetical protein
MCAFWRIGSSYKIEVHLDVTLDYRAGGLADLVQLLARADAWITDLEPDRSRYSFGLAEGSARVSYRVRSVRHGLDVLEALERERFVYRVDTAKMRRDSD